MQKDKRRRLWAVAGLVVALLAAVLWIGGALSWQLPFAQSAATSQTSFEAPDYSGELSVEVNGNVPTFTDDEISQAEAGSFEDYSPLDALGRCGPALACLGEETMPTEERGDISDIHPTGWHQEFYDFVDQEAVYNRSHLIAYSLSAENANERNLITGTRTMNNEGMRPFEEETARYIERTGNHVLYLSEPVFEGDDLLAGGVHLMARSVEDGGEGLSFNVYVFNVEPGVEIDYATGENQAA